MRCIDIQRICKRRMSVQINRAFPPNPKRNNYVNRIGREDEKGIRKSLQKDFISWVGRHVKPFWSEDGVGVECFCPLVETGGSCRIPSPPPDPTGSCHLNCSALQHFAAITIVMRNLQYLRYLMFCVTRLQFSFSFAACLSLSCESV